MSTSKSSSPEKKLAEYGITKLKKIFLVVVAVVGHWQLYEYVTVVPNITVFLEKSISTEKGYKTKISVQNGSESILKNDVIRPIAVLMNSPIDSTNVVKSPIDPTIVVKRDSIIINFDLFNRHEEIIMYLYSEVRPEIEGVDLRIKNIESVDFYDYQFKTKFFSRSWVWLLLILLAALLFADALLVITRDRGLQNIKYFIYEFPLNKNNKDQFIKGYSSLYSDYKLRFKPPAFFMEEVIKNLFKSFPSNSKNDMDLIKRLVDFKTELYTYYRVRTAFVIISPVIGGFSLLALLVNFFYYDWTGINEYISLNSLNKTIIILLFLVTILVILFPRYVMSLVFLKRGAKIKF